jgi:hypothetical protein
MYYSDAADIEELGRERLASDAWQSIFVGYRSSAGIRSICRWWSDLLQVGVGLSQPVADELVRSQVILRQDRDLMTIRDSEQLLVAMDQVLADVGVDLAEAPELGAMDRGGLIAALNELRRLVLDAG